ncbi:MAG: hypothetical protein PHO20_01345 [Candidatus Peribacteraceae bacterium]|nr:hypothetical protein [Candidatus Peribacteraceae bacterium]MDD5739393.1 hypothetical protein [Candidatus Peribacteraceae bacterium]
MISLCIEPIPLKQALRNDTRQNEEILEATRAAITAQNIAGLQWGTSHAFQCALWLRGPAEAIASLRTFLDSQNMRHEAYEGTTDDTDDSHTEPDAGKRNPTAKQ